MPTVKRNCKKCPMAVTLIAWVIFILFLERLVQALDCLDGLDGYRHAHALRTRCARLGSHLMARFLQRDQHIHFSTVSWRRHAEIYSCSRHPAPVKTPADRNLAPFRSEIPVQSVTPAGTMPACGLK